MDTIQKTAAQIIETIEIRLLGEDTEEEATDTPSALSYDRVLVGV